MTSAEDEPRELPTIADELLEIAWGIIANAGNGDWTRETPEWHRAASKWREEYHELLASAGKPGIVRENPEYDPADGAQNEDYGFVVEGGRQAIPSPELSFRQLVLVVYDADAKWQTTRVVSGPDIRTPVNVVLTEDPVNHGNPLREHLMKRHEAPESLLTQLEVADAAGEAMTGLHQGVLDRTHQGLHGHGFAEHEPEDLS